MQRTLILATMAALTVTSFSADAATRKRSGRTASAAERSATADLNRKSLEQASMAAPAGAMAATPAMTPAADGMATPPAGDAGMTPGASAPMAPGADNMAPSTTPPVETTAPDATTAPTTPQ